MNGINFLEAHNLIPHDPKSIAWFLKDTPGLDRVRAPVCLLSLVTEHAQAIPWCSLYFSAVLMWVLTAAAGDDWRLFWPRR